MTWASASPRPREDTTRHKTLTRRRRFYALITAAVLAVAACNGDPVDTTTTSMPNGPTTTDDPGETTTTPPSEETTTTQGAEGDPWIITSGDVSITLPGGWVGADVAGEATGVGDVMFPDVPDYADVIDQVVMTMPPEVILFALDPARIEEEFVDNLNILIDDTVPDDVEFEDMVEAQAEGIEAFGATVNESDIIDLGGRDVGRIQSDFDLYDTATYIISEDGTTYVITFAFDVMAVASLDQADDSVATFSTD